MGLATIEDIAADGLPATKVTVPIKEIPATVPVTELAPATVEVRFAAKEPLELVVPDG